MAKQKVVYFPDLEVGWVVETRIIHLLGVKSATDLRVGARADYSHEGLSVDEDILQRGLFNVIKAVKRF